ncbi:hypothetical protein SAMN02982927_00479 [Sporolactobacillus nakayamae]|uniref:Uncharacterized protein n=1 Tax=Sporolactobacillus nakayamae TaxID=269670 RepID=A0A1I2NQW4_9BACL|nr:hypothetical protein SAMN02982927_00479 [Sporolactobacillus nakayamae]
MYELAEKMIIHFFGFFGFNRYYWFSRSISEISMAYIIKNELNMMHEHYM